MTDERKTLTKVDAPPVELVLESDKDRGVTALVPVSVKTDELVPANIFTPEERAQIAERVKGKTLASMSEQEIVLWGSGRERELGQKLDALLAHVTKEDSPEVFEVFKRVKKGIKDVKLEEVEEEIRKSLAEPWYIKVLQKIPLLGQDPEDRIEEMSEHFRRLILGKTTTLQDMTSKMEDKVQGGVRALIAGSVSLSRQVDEFETNVIAYGMEVAAGRIILEAAREHEAALIEEARQTKDPIKAQNARDFQQRMMLFENRLLVLKTAYVDAPVTLEMLGGIKTAGLQTLSETASAMLGDFNKIKSLLLMLVALYKIKSVQQMNAQRRLVKQQLQRLYEVVGTEAARVAGDNRLEDAQMVLTVATELERIGDKVAGIHEQNKQKFAQAEKLLIQARDKISQIGLKEKGLTAGDPLAKY